MSGINTFTFDLYDNTYSKDFKKNISLEFSYNLITKFSKQGRNIKKKFLRRLQSHDELLDVGELPVLPGINNNPAPAVEKNIIELIINSCIDMEKPNLGVYLKNIKKFIDLKTEDKCTWKGIIDVQNNTFQFKTISYKSITSDTFPIVRKYNLSQLTSGVTYDNCTLIKEDSKSIFNCTFY